MNQGPISPLPDIFQYGSDLTFDVSALLSYPAFHL